MKFTHTKQILHAIRIDDWAHRCEVGCKSLEVLRHSLIQVCLGGPHNLILIVLLKLLCLLRLDAAPILQHMVLGDFLHAYSYLSGVQPGQNPAVRPAWPSTSGCKEQEQVDDPGTCTPKAL